MCIRDSGKEGFLVPPGNAERLAEAISLLLNDADLRKEMGRKGRERTVREFDWNIKAKEVLNVYLEVLKMRQ